MPFTKDNTIGTETRFKTGQSGNPAGRSADKLRKHINTELEKIGHAKQPANKRPLRSSRPALNASLTKGFRQFPMPSTR
jgi:hypothetical protein